MVTSPAKKSPWTNVHRSSAVRVDPAGMRPLRVPFDDFGEGVDHGEGGEPEVGKRGQRGVPEAKSADGYVQRAGAGATGNATAGEFFLRDGEEAGHEVLVVEFDFVDFFVKRGIPAFAEHEIAHRGRSQSSADTVLRCSCHGPLRVVG